jgi:hypothetical protein
MDMQNESYLGLLNSASVTGLENMLSFCTKDLLGRPVLDMMMMMGQPWIWKLAQPGVVGTIRAGFGKKNFLLSGHLPRSEIVTTSRGTENKQGYMHGAILGKLTAVEDSKRNRQPGELNGKCGEKGLSLGV